MSGKLKILLSVLALGALFSGYYLTSIFRAPLAASLDSAFAPATSSSDNPCAKDTDHDGLNDCEETYWKTDYQNPDTDGDGFLDGEEVLSGHDPTKKGPDDWLDKRKNVTQRAASLIIGGVMVGDLKPDSPNYDQSVTKLTAAIVKQYRDNSQVPEELVILSGDTRADVIAYGTVASNLIGPAFSAAVAGFQDVTGTIKDVQFDDLKTLATDNPEQYKAFTAAIVRRISALGEQAASIARLKVPPGMVTGHKNVLMLLRGMQKQYIFLKQIKQDPFQGILAMQSLTVLNTNTVQGVAQDFAIRLNAALSR